MMMRSAVKLRPTLGPEGNAWNTPGGAPGKRRVMRRAVVSNTAPCQPGGALAAG